MPELNDAQKTWIRSVKGHAQAIVNEATTAHQFADEDAKRQLQIGTEHLETAIMWLTKGFAGGRTYDTAPDDAMPVQRAVGIGHNGGPALDDMPDFICDDAGYCQQVSEGTA